MSEITIGAPRVLAPCVQCEGKGYLWDARCGETPCDDCKCLGWFDEDGNAVKRTREEEMIVLARDANGTPTIWCDPEIVSLVLALNTHGLKTVASCSGHGEKPGWIALADGRQLAIFQNIETLEAKALS